MKPKTAFWDSSALAPLCCQQPSSARARQLARRLTRQIVWWGTTTEITSALARLDREGRLTPGLLRQHLEQLERLQNGWIEVLPVEQVRLMAADLLLRYPLRGADSLQLAAALAWCKQNPRRRPFVCFDERLAQVAEEVGFEVYRFE